MMATITFYGGVNEIGGNKILVESGGVRVWLDFGMSFAQAGRYLAEFLQPRKCNGLNDFMHLGLLPRLGDLTGLYREDYLRHGGYPPAQEATYQAVFLTHAHADHYAYIHFLRSDMPVYASEVTKRILAATEETSSSGFAEYTRFRETFQIRPSKRGAGMTKLHGEEAESLRDFRVTADYAPTRVGTLEIQALPVDHSVPGALAYALVTEAGPIVYTGDLRAHGYHPELTMSFVEQVSGLRPSLLISEGTHIGEGPGLSEADVEARVQEIVGRTDGLIIFNCPIRDVERLVTFLKVAKHAGRKLAVNLKQAYLLRLLDGLGGAPTLDDPDLAVYVQRKGWGLLTKTEYPDNIREQDYDKWEREFLTHPSRVTCEDVRKNQKDFIVRIDFFDLKDLVDLQPREGSCYIRSVTEPFDDEGEIELRKVEEWLKLFGLFPYHQVHASGHASGTELVEMIKEIKPRFLVPVHTEHPEYFLEALRGEPVEVRLPEYGVPMVVG